MRRTTMFLLGLLVVGACGSDASRGTLADGTCSDAPSVVYDEPETYDGRVEIDVSFQSGCVWLGGTLMLPDGEGPFPALVFAHGSGPMPRLSYDADFAGTLLGAGYALLSWDKRGVGASHGQCCDGDDSDFHELADDQLTALRVLRSRDDIDPTRLGLIAVSQGGWVVPIVVERSPDVAGAVVLSGSAVTTGEEIHYSDLTDDGDDPSLTEAELERRLDEVGPSGFDPAPFLELMDVPTFWAYGAEDRSQPVGRSVEVLERLAADGKDITVRVFDGLGHDVTHSDRVMDEVVAWLDDVLMRGRERR